MLDRDGGIVTDVQSTNAILDSLSFEDMRYLKSRFERVEIGAGASFDCERNYVFFVEEGIVILSSEKSGLTVGFVGSEGTLGVFGRFGLDEEPFQATALTAITALRISSKDFEKAVDGLPYLRRAIIEYVLNLMRELAAEIHKVATQSLCARVAAWLLAVTERGHTSPIMITHHAIAACLQVRRAGVTDALHIPEGQKAVRSTRGTIEVLDVNVLRTVATT
jgi:CRP-like cAMP-binding protein